MALAAKKEVRRFAAGCCCCDASNFRLATPFLSAILSLAWRAKGTDRKRQCLGLCSADAADSKALYDYCFLFFPSYCLDGSMSKNTPRKKILHV